MICYYFSHSLTLWNSQLLSVLLASEEEIQTRSKAIESHWSPDKYQDKSSGKIEFSSFKIHSILYNKINVHQTVSGLAKKPFTHSGLEKSLEFQLILNLGKQLLHLFCLSGQQLVYVCACFNYWFSWKMISFILVANQASDFKITGLARKSAHSGLFD